MADNQIRHIIAFGVSGGFLFCCISVALIMALGFLDPRDGLSILKDFSGVYSGIIGVIVGYYFERRNG